jgi:hypothetical protein
MRDADDRADGLDAPHTFCPPLKPLGAGSEVRKRRTAGVDLNADGGGYRYYDGPRITNLTPETVERFAPRLMLQDHEPATEDADLTPRGAALIVAACTAGALLGVVGLAYLWAKVTGL